MVLDVAPVHATLLDVCLYPRHGSQGQGCQAFSHRIGQQYQRGLRNVRQSWLSVRSPIQPIARRRQPQKVPFSIYLSVSSIFGIFQIGWLAEALTAD